VTLIYNCVMLAVDVLAIWLIGRRKTLPVWCGAMALVGVVGAALGGWIAGRYENHFGFFRLSAYGVFLHVCGLLLATAALWRRERPRLAGAALALALGLVMVVADAFFVEPHWLEVTHWQIASPKIHHPMRIVVVADLQTNRIGPYERSVFRRALDEKPDVILMAGDYLQVPWKQEPILQSELNQLLRELHFTAPLGVYAVQGNVDPPGWTKIFEGLDIITTSKNRSFDLGEVHLTCLGLNESYNPYLCVMHDSPEQFHMVLGHVPNFALGKIQADLLVAGHTHGGQVRLPLIGPMITHSCIPHTWAAGLTELPGGGRLLVSRGIGMERSYAPPIRFLCRPELTVIDLMPEPE
jgi:predicted MPP superfamily phosphohydrolase